MFILDRLLDQKGYVLADGATGTNYFMLGLETGYPPELWSLEKPEHVAGLHRRFIEAGSDMILSNSFGGTRHRLKLHQSEHRVAELNEASARLARAEAKHQLETTGREVMVAGSMGPTGELFTPLGALTMRKRLMPLPNRPWLLPKAVSICCGLKPFHHLKKSLPQLKAQRKRVCRLAQR